MKGNGSKNDDDGGGGASDRSYYGDDVPRRERSGRSEGRRPSDRPGGPRRRSNSVSSARSARSSSSSNGSSRGRPAPPPAGRPCLRVLRSPSERLRIVRTSLAVGLALLISTEVRQISNVAFRASDGRGSGGALEDGPADSPRPRRSFSRGDDDRTSTREGGFRNDDDGRPSVLEGGFIPRNVNGLNDNMVSIGEEWKRDNGGRTSTSTRKRKGKFVLPRNNGQNVVVSMEEEFNRVEALYDDRARRRRARTRPPAASDPHDAPPRLILDLPAHRSLNDRRTGRDRRLLDRADGIWQRLFGLFSNTGATNGVRGRSQDEKPRTNDPCGSHATEASGRRPENYPASARLGPKSRVVVTGALSQLGMELILHLHERCGVESIRGVDAALPNTRQDRAEMIETRYERVRTRVPGFQRLAVPEFGVLSGAEGFDNPTHVVHLGGHEEGRGEHADLGDAAGGSPFSDERNSGMMRRFTSLLSMDQVLSSLAGFDSSSGDAGATTRPRPQLVYVTSDEADGRSGVPLKGGAAVPRPASVHGTSCLLNEVLASYYRVRRGVRSAGVRVPTVFGPFSRPGSLLHDLAERTVRSAAGDDGAEGVPRRPRDGRDLQSVWERREGAASGEAEEVAYVSDVARAIVAAMQFRDDSDDPSVGLGGPTLMRLGSNIAVSMRDMKAVMERYLPPDDKREAAPESSGESHESNSLANYDAERNRDLLGWTQNTGLREGTRSMLAWHILNAYPFGLPATAPSYTSFQTLLEGSRDSLPYRSLPCASGCQWGGGMCSTSVWDDVVDTTREITETCKYVLYTVDLRPELNKMKKQSAPSQSKKSLEDSFCKIALVSSSSELAGTIYSKELEEKTPMNEWNGKGKEGHWIIVAVPGTQFTMPEFERSLAKLTPTNLFSDGVEKALFVDLRKLTVTTDQAMTVINHMRMDEKTTTTTKKIVDKKKEVQISIPPRRPRRSVFFAAKFAFPAKYGAEKLAAFVMGKSGIAETAGIRAQRDFYEHASHLTLATARRSVNYQDHFGDDNRFRFEFLDSSWLAHDLGSEEGRVLRCEMYEEHSLWGNGDMEDMSVGFVLARRRAKARLGRTAAIHENAVEWDPFLVPKDPGEDGAVAEGPAYLDYLESSRKVATDGEGAEFYVSLLPKKQKK